MINTILRRISAGLTFLIVGLPLFTQAQQLFTDTSAGDVDAGFRKTGSFAEQYEMVAYLGNISNFMAMAVGTSTNFSFYTNQLAIMCPTNTTSQNLFYFGNLQWSVFSSFELTGGSGKLTNSSGVWPVETCWYTVPRTNVNVQTVPNSRFTYNTEGNLTGHMIGIGNDANATSSSLYSEQGNTNATNNFQLVLEPVNYLPQDLLTVEIGDSANSALGDFGGNCMTFSAENVTSNSFTSPVVSDFYVNVPTGHGTEIDPLTGLTTGNADYLGYFTLYTNGVMTFTRALPAPSVSSVSASTTNGFAPLTVAFSDTTSGSATNWVWNFGNGTIITNTTSGNVTNSYTTAGSYTVTLTAYGPGGSSSYTVANYVVADPRPSISLTTPSGQMIFSGSNCPAGDQYRILTSTNLLTTLANWTPIYTNTFTGGGTFSYTNLIGATNHFFIMVSP